MCFRLATPHRPPKPIFAKICGERSGWSPPAVAALHALEQHDMVRQDRRQASPSRRGPAPQVRAPGETRGAARRDPQTGPRPHAAAGPAALVLHRAAPASLETCEADTIGRAGHFLGILQGSAGDLKVPQIRIHPIDRASEAEDRKPNSVQAFITPVGACRNHCVPLAHQSVVRGPDRMNPGELPTGQRRRPGRRMPASVSFEPGRSCPMACAPLGSHAGRFAVGGHAPGWRLGCCPVAVDVVDDQPSPAGADEHTRHALPPWMLLPQRRSELVGARRSFPATDAQALDSGPPQASRLGTSGKRSYGSSAHAPHRANRFTSPLVVHQI